VIRDVLRRSCQAGQLQRIRRRKEVFYATQIIPERRGIVAVVVEGGGVGCAHDQNFFSTG
jgi:hypothetical protein